LRKPSTTTVNRLATTKAAADELEDCLELQDPKIKALIRESHKDYMAGRTRPAKELLAELGRPT